MALLHVENLCVDFGPAAHPLRAVDDVSFTLDTGEILGIVGESGSGKSVTSLAILGLIDAPGRVRATRIEFDGTDLLQLASVERRRLLGSEIAMIFQEPLTSLNPSFTVGHQVEEMLSAHTNMGKSERRDRVVELLEQVGIPDAARRLRAFPHQMSGGMNQRVMIAMAVACNPRLLIADEPSTALDVTIQAQILDLLVRLQQERDMALILITHDLGVVAETAQRAMVMYAGQIVEREPVDRLFSNPRHPYTEALLESLPQGKQRGELKTIPGVVPGLDNLPVGCYLNPRCRYAEDRCREVMPELRSEGDSAVRCHFPLGASN
ncbi:MAG: ABC transporter ATP-binding protein [Gammaproteobacteria bacterium]|nr:ABC transporter ATP-binding protein [Gammaproteobacteria bacterium]